MQKKPSEWVSISDLMSGVLAVVMLLLVISVLQKTYAEIKHKQELEGGQQGRKQQMTTTLNAIEQEFQQKTFCFSRKTYKGNKLHKACSIHFTDSNVTLTQMCDHSNLAG